MEMMYFLYKSCCTHVGCDVNDGDGLYETRFVYENVTIDVINENLLYT